MSYIIDLTGKRFNRLLVILFSHVSESRTTYWFCKCDCGNEKIISSPSLIHGKIQSCGCLRQENLSRVGKRNKTHGLSRSFFYKIWQGMRQRCGNSNDSKYQRYGGSGIKVCDRWLNSFENFMEDMHESYLEHVKEFGKDNTSLDRYPNQQGGYEPENVRWATPTQQARNTKASSTSEDYEAHLYWKHRLYTNLNIAIKSNCKTSKLLEPYLGCSLPEFKIYIESQFLIGMTWENHGKGPSTWQFDHREGCNNFDLSKEEDRKACFNYKNIHPMWWNKHKNKSTKRKELQNESI